MASVVADELLIRIRADDQLSAVLAQLHVQLASLTAPLAQIQSASTGAFGHMSGMMNPVVEAMTDLGKAVADVALKFGGDALNNATRFEDRLVTIERISGLSKEGIKALEEQLINLGIELRRPTESLAAAAEEAARLGIQGPELMKFVKIVDQFAIATGGSAQDAARAMANMRQIFHEELGGSVEDLNKVASAVVALDQATAATAPQIIEGMRRVTNAVMLGLKPEFVAAVVAQLTSMGTAAEAAGTQFSSALTFLLKPTKMAAAAAVMKMTTLQFREALEKNATGAIMALLAQMDKLPTGVQKSQAHFEVFGAVGKKATEKLGIALTELQRLITVGTDAALRGNEAIKASEFALSTTGAAMERLTNAYFGLTLAVGEKFLPAKKMAANALRAFVESTRQAIKGMGTFEVAVGGLVAALSAFAVVGGGRFLVFFGSMSTAILTALGPIGRLVVAVGNASVALAGANSMAAALILTLGRLSVLMLIFANWEVIWDGWSKIFGLFYGAFDALMKKLDPIMPRIKEIAMGVLAAAGGVLVDLGKVLAVGVGLIIRHLAVMAGGLIATMPAGLAKWLGVDLDKARGKLYAFADDVPRRLSVMVEDVSKNLGGFMRGLLNLGDAAKVVQKDFEASGAKLSEFARLPPKLQAQLNALKLPTDQLTKFGDALKWNVPALMAFVEAMRAGLSPVEAFKRAQDMLAGSTTKVGDALSAMATRARELMGEYGRLPDAIDVVRHVTKDLGRSLSAQEEEYVVLLAQLSAVDEAYGRISSALLKWQHVMQRQGKDLAADDMKKLQALQKQQQELGGLAAQYFRLLEAKAKDLNLTDELQEKLAISARVVGVAAHAGKELADSNDAVHASMNKVTAAAETQKTRLEFLRDAYKTTLDFLVRMAEVTEKQIVGAMNALAESMKATASTLTGMVPVILELMKSPSEGFGGAFRERILAQFDLQRKLGEQQILLNEENLATLRQRRELLSGKGAIHHKVDVEGGPEAFQAIYKSVLNQILFKAQTGGDLCCG